MSKKSVKRENPEEIIDSFESWLERQKPKQVRARPGFLADAKIGESG